MTFFAPCFRVRPPCGGHAGKSPRTGAGVTEELMTGRVQSPPAAGVTEELMTGRVQSPPAAGVTEELMTGAGSGPPRRGRY
ncbi:hypothetical protein NDU88_011629 [Pleurodeles waltl]|uniref:Uncharacterized protein n=1 Tax=Pleurodeles waltl TaxID=8319 RepID=A0AAV7PZE0_PLEWA|nr:hypothetical protein NDU88_011629 [Pleurodeles waltl]